MSLTRGGRPEARYEWIRRPSRIRSNSGSGTGINASVLMASSKWANRRRARASASSSAAGQKWMTKSTSDDRDRDLAVGDLHVVAHDAHLRIEHRLAGGDVVLPGMPGATQDAAFLAVLELVHGAGQRGADDPAE